MLKVVNKLVTEKKLSAAKAYAQFGREQLQEVNRQSQRWLREQAFARDAPSPQYAKMEISGNSNDSCNVGHSHGPIQDNVQWELKFKHQLPDSLTAGYIAGALDEGLLHIKRAPAIAAYNSAPGIFSTANYIQLRVGNGERGWVEKGEFPVGPHIERRLVSEEELKYEDVAVHTDIRRDAEEGFRAAAEWAKFRTMAVVANGYISERLKKELAQLSERAKVEEWPHERKWHAAEFMKSRAKHSIPFMLGLLPDCSVSDGPQALRRDYVPGVLEGELALELFKARKDWPIYLIDGKPTETSPLQDNGAFDANFTFDVTLSGGSNLSKDEAVRASVSRELEKYFDIKVASPTAMQVRFHIPEAHKVREAILGGKEDTCLHSQINSLVDALGNVTRLYRSWQDDVMPVMVKGFEAAVEKGKEEYFGPKLEQRLLRMPHLPDRRQ